MLGLLKLSCPIVMVVVLTCFVKHSLSSANAQQAVYPYPAAQQASQFNSGNSGFTGGLNTGALNTGGTYNTGSAVNGFSQQSALQFPSQTQNQPANFQFLPGPIQSQLTQPQTFPAQQNFTTQPGLGVSAGVPQGSLPANIDVYIPTGPTGKLLAGGTIGSDNGFVGEIIVDERDFNIFAFPKSLNDLFNNPQVFRGAGQSFRAEIVPGSDLERYLVSFGDPYFLSTDVSVNLSGYYFDRQFFDWDEQRSGGKLRLGRTLTPYLTLRGGLQLENVNIDNARVNTSNQLNSVLGNSNLFSFDVGLVYDTRQSPYLLDSGSYLAATFRQAFGDYDFSRAEIDYRVQRLIYKRTATTGHHTLSYRTKLGFTGGSTPVFENFIAGGVNSLRGFDFRGVSPVEGNVRVGGEFQWLNSLEYQFPITNDDMIMGVTFIDFGTVESDIEINSDNFRVAPGVGIRANVPFLGISAPLSLDFAFPVDEAFGDDKRTISFLLGIVR